MSDLTPSFNDASSGLSGGETATVGGGPGPHPPSGSASATASTQSAASSIDPGKAPLQPPPASKQKFNVNAPPTQAPARTTTPTKPAKLDAHTASAKAELETLKRAKPDPAARHNLKPPANVKRAADNRAERQRLARISAVNAYLKFRQSPPENEQEMADELEFRL